MNIRQATHRHHSRRFLDTAQQSAVRPDDGNAFLLDPQDGSETIGDDLGEEIAESFLQSATSGQDASQERLDPEELDEMGGSFVETTAEQELGLDSDASTPEEEVEWVPRSGTH